MIERSTNGVTFSQIGTFGASAGTGAVVATVDAPIVPTTAITYSYRVRATNLGGIQHQQYGLCDRAGPAASTEQPDRGQRREQKQGALDRPGLE